ncbi:alanine:cation symporter family protein [Staphylococcus aureus]
MIFKEMIQLMFQGEKSPNGISSFQAIAMSFQAGLVQVILCLVYLLQYFFGGGLVPVFWMWILDLGASSAFIESTLIIGVHKDKIMNTVVDQRIILNMVLVVNLVKI